MTSFKSFLFALFQARHHKVFPSLARFDTFSELPSEIHDGNPQAVYGPSVFLNPLSLWRLLRGDTSQYPGPLSDFSASLGHFNQRQCWCVDRKGAMKPDSKALVNQVPKCKCQPQVGSIHNVFTSTTKINMFPLFSRSRAMLFGTDTR